ncbi:hypothetical protein ACH4LQ_11165 [Streptomyces globisporus]
MNLASLLLILFLLVVTLLIGAGTHHFSRTGERRSRGGGFAPLKR